GSIRQRPATGSAVPSTSRVMVGEVCEEFVMPTPCAAPLTRRCGGSFQRGNSRPRHNGPVGSPGATSGAPALVRALGELAVEGPGGPIEIRPGIPRALLTMLVLRVSTVVAAEALIDGLW